jgi:Xaa-Pro aminopeptidase
MADLRDELMGLKTDENGVVIDVQPIAERVNNRSMSPVHSKAFREFMQTGWRDDEPEAKRLESADHAATRRTELGKQFEGQRIVIPAGNAKARNNDCDYPFRPDTTFAYYTGLGQDHEPGAVLVLEPVLGAQGDEPTHTAKLFLHHRADHTTSEFYSSSQFGEYWIGPRPGLDEFETMTGIQTCDISELPEALALNVGRGSDHVDIRIIRETDPALTDLVEGIRESSGFANSLMNSHADDYLHEVAAKQRMIKDPYEIKEMRKAIDATKDGFDRILGELGRATDNPHGERILEGAFHAVSREEGNGEGYGSIVASGNHAPTLHWERNTGAVRINDMLLIDAGIEVDSLYTADITRTFPVSGKFTDVQRMLYSAVLESQLAGFEAAKLGAMYCDVHFACMRVIAEKLHEWGVLKVDVEEALSAQGQQFRRWLASGVAHHLGLDVHDCAQAKFEDYQQAPLAPGLIFTIEPGRYFRENDELIPPEFRGIGIRIEDDVLMTEHGPEWLSKSVLPSAPDDVEKWMADHLVK